MDIIVKNLPDQITEKQVENFFRPHLARLSIKTFGCRKTRGRGTATITIEDLTKAESFLKLHGQTKSGPEGFRGVQQKLRHMRRDILCFRSTHVPDRFLLQSLKQEDEKKALVDEARKAESGKARGPSGQRKFNIVSLACGQWDYVDNGSLAFMSHFHEQRRGRMLFGKGLVMINIDPPMNGHPGHRIEIPYHDVEMFTIGGMKNPTVTFSLRAAPKLFEDILPSAEDLIAAMGNLGIQKSRPTFQRKRVHAICKAHEIVVSSCFCYRFMLQMNTDIKVIQALKNVSHIPESISWDSLNIVKPNFSQQLTLLNISLGKLYDNVSFEVKFQFQRLAQNGVLSPARVVELFKRVVDMGKEIDDVTLIPAVQRLFNQVPFSGPHTRSEELSVDTLMAFLARNQEDVKSEALYAAGLVEKHEHIALIHKAMVTPAGIYLSGPEQEVKNRVLRRYSAFTSYFLQVSFLDEDGEALRYSRIATNDEIYQNRFKKVLEGIIMIAGRGYEFLGFSHSSLRSQTCWFMAPFPLDGEVLHSRLVIKRLGEFSQIRSPAKCAARIGQAFSQTFSSINLPKEAIGKIPEVERNNRVFSDGVGTCSDSVMRKIWKEYAQSRGLKPTVFQIRFRGAKGMISLDTRLNGDVLCLRDSMIKFEGEGSDIEICGAGLKPLPMFLNRPLIKILEDLGVPESAFLHLQEVAVDQLRMTTESPVNAANFLQRNYIGKAARLPWLVRKLLDLNIYFNEDDFLRNVLELAILMQLRELKHRMSYFQFWDESSLTSGFINILIHHLYVTETTGSRIFVENGMTLYGIMDETGVLEEGQIFCTVSSEEKGTLILTGSVVVTRSPAMHPGDVQCASAVQVPADSPLMSLRNCVVFSSKGNRDLPSQLSGGDLDGDLFNVIHDASLYPARVADPADYPIQKPINIGREVVRSDMTAFFIQFMENDQLGRIATLHQTLADQKPAGTFDPDCVLLAGLHSLAVDFSKTGIPADLTKMPRHSNVRPDFQAPGPRVLVDKSINVQEDSDDEPDDRDDDNEEASMPQLRYYPSQKVLGKLYRVIDEHEIFKQIQRQSRSSKESLKPGKDAITRVWNYVQKVTALIEYRHLLPFARLVEESYEENLEDSMRIYSTHPNHYLSEVEVFCGSILGKIGAASRRQRENSTSMKEKHERDVAYTVALINQGEENDQRAEALERSIACLEVACTTTRVRKKVGRLVSFGWIAAAVCLREVERFQGL